MMAWGYFGVNDWNAPAEDEQANERTGALFPCFPVTVRDLVYEGHAGVAGRHGAHPGLCVTSP